MKMQMISNLYQYHLKSYFESKNNIIDMNMKYSNNYCLYSLKTKIYSV